MRIGGTSYSGKVWLGKVILTRNQPPRFFIYDLGRNEITLEISSLRYWTEFLLSTFWDDDIENIMNLET